MRVFQPNSKRHQFMKPLLTTMLLLFLSVCAAIAADGQSFEITDLVTLNAALKP